MYDGYAFYFIGTINRLIQHEFQLIYITNLGDNASMSLNNSGICLTRLPIGRSATPIFTLMFSFI